MRDTCDHRVGPIAVSHVPGTVVASCEACDRTLSIWLGAEDATASELRGLAADLEDHVYRHHPEIDTDVTQELRRCASGAAPRRHGTRLDVGGP